MDQREKDIQELCEAVLHAETEFWDNPNGPYTYSCPFCNAEMYHDCNGIHELKHDQGCAYLIAKDLSTGYRIKQQ